ncbi:Zn-dependent hydrolase [Rhodovibrio sodomensis]|uniref:Zn-dependent hydrolase n=1 Tax=Rhodovibrio sodomensis TaxID=1088 RepID=A0ABS1DK31_9PROT|nr:Zn-dependent hydrolase [Rhodovibrio sodomensis]MBK1670860.1 Zn-dependent hydrolase [Rhodovibrio sodomensis]
MDGQQVANLAIDEKRLWDALMEVAQYGATAKGGNNRLTLTDLDRQVRDLFAGWCDQAGMSMTVDRMGNMFARRPGRRDDLAPVMAGSHLDTQPTGGKYDGVLGVLAALELVRTLNDRGIETERPIEIVNWTNEEGSRFAPAMISSGVFAGAFTMDWAYARTDRDGHSLGEELARIGYRGDAPVGGRDIHAFFELHIEQGPILEAEEKTIGVVTDCQGQRWYELTLTGFEAHAGPTPMDRRRDALLGAARVIDLVNRIGLARAPSACATVGQIDVHPNSRNVIPGAVFLTIDFRHPDNDVLEDMCRALEHGVAEIAEAIGLERKLEQIFSFRPVHFDETCVAAVRKGAQACGYSHRDILSGAGHDAVYVAAVAPTAMVFVPCVDGVSHNETEACKPEWVTAGANVLLHAVLEMAGRVD